MMQRLLPIPEAADMLGVPAESLRRAADYHGKTIVIGRAVRLHPADLQELLDLCRVPPKVPASTSDSAKVARPSGSSSTKGPSSQLARQTAAALKERSRNTSTGRDAQVVPLRLTE
jgi:hypothetical protein